MRTRLQPLALLLFIFLTGPLFSQPADTSWSAKTRTIFNELYNHPDPVVSLTIETNFRNIINKKALEEYKKATLTYKDANQQTISHDIQIRARGNRRKEVCYFPPLKMKFSKTLLGQDGYEPFHEIKLANSCRPGEVNEMYLFKEYLAYRLYNLITPYSFRVRLARITYIDVDRKGQPTELYALLIEPETELCARLGAQPVQRKITYGAFMERDLFGQMEIFQYMIGNTDWNLANLHNIATIKAPERPKTIAVPYDFDYCGMVGTDYALPHESMPIKDVRERFHKGEAIEAEHIQALTEQFRRLVPQFQAACQGLEPFNPRAARETADYLAPFFKMLNDPKWMKQVFVDKQY